MKLHISTYIVILICCIVISTQAQEIPRFGAQDGLAIVEMESLIVPDAWRVDTTTRGFTGSSYLNYRGSNLFNTPGDHKMTVEILIA
ncbi:MAG: hypothetical protein AAGI23_06140 [Bacteroidota bacterium]